MTKRLATIILPLYKSNGSTAIEGHDWLRKYASETFGGWTGATVTGGWVDSRGKSITDSSVRYDIAVDDVPSSYTTLRAMASQLASVAEQEVIYLGLPNGEIEFIGYDGHAYP